MPRAFEYRHVVLLEETNLLGNVYYTHHLRWQGACREHFLKTHVPTMLAAFDAGFRLVTLKVSCEYFVELRAFDDIVMRMRLLDQAQNRLTLGFELARLLPAGEERAARGEQEIAAMRLDGDRLVAAPWPPAFKEALTPFGGEP